MDEHRLATSLGWPQLAGTAVYDKGLPSPPQSLAKVQTPSPAQCTYLPAQDITQDAIAVIEYCQCTI